MITSAQSKRYGITPNIEHSEALRMIGLIRRAFAYIWAFGRCIQASQPLQTSTQPEK